MRRLILIVAIAVVVVIFIITSSQKGINVEPIAVAESESWMGVYLKDKKIGYSYSAIKGVTGGYQIENKVKWDLFVMGVRQTILAYVEAHTDSSFRLRDFYLDFQSPSDKKKVKGEFSGRDLNLQLFSKGKWLSEQRKVSEVPILPEALEKILLKEGLKPGRKFEMSFFDPITQAIQKVSGEVIGKSKIRIHKEEITATQINLKVAGLPTTVWIDSLDQIVKHETSLGMTMIRESRSEALCKIQPVEALDIIFLFRVKSDTSILNPRAVNHLIIEIANLDTVGLDFEDDVQRVLDEKPFTVRIDVRNIIPKKSLLLPIKEYQEALKPTIYIQCDAEEIKKLAREIAGGEKSALVVGQKLVNWVFQNLEKKATASLPSATSILRDRYGDCNEHAVLLAALARAAGIPAKIYVGLVNLGDAFYYHAWNGIYIGRWIPVDATYGQFPADATHIKLKEGNIEEQVKVLKVVDQVKIKVREFE